MFPRPHSLPRPVDVTFCRDGEVQALMVEQAGTAVRASCTEGVSKYAVLGVAAVLP